MTILQPLALATLTAAALDRRPRRRADRTKDNAMTPLEHAARAIYAADPQLGPDGPVPWDSQHTPLRAVCIAQARAAIEAIREPTEATLQAGISPWDQMPGTDDECLTAIWQAMCDVILAEP